MEQKDVNPSVVIIVKDIQYIMDNHKYLQYNSTGRVAEVREFLEERCGFKKDIWSTKKYTGLNWLHVARDRVYGNYEPAPNLQRCDIHDLVNEYFSNKQEYRQINLKG